MFLNKLVDMVDFGLFPKNVIATFWLSKSHFFTTVQYFTHYKKYMYIITS